MRTTSHLIIEVEIKIDSYSIFHTEHDDNIQFNQRSIVECKNGNEKKRQLGENNHTKVDPQ